MAYPISHAVQYQVSCNMYPPCPKMALPAQRALDNVNNGFPNKRVRTGSKYFGSLDLVRALRMMDIVDEPEGE